MKSELEDPALQQAQKAVVFFGAVFVLVAFGYFSGHAAFSVLCGAAMASLNLFLLSRAVQNLMAGHNQGWALAAVFKFAALLVVVYLLLQSGLVLPIGLAAGFGALPLGVFVAGVWGSRPTPSSTASVSRPRSGRGSDAA